MSIEADSLTLVGSLRVATAYDITTGPCDADVVQAHPPVTALQHRAGSGSQSAAARGRPQREQRGTDAHTAVGSVTARIRRSHDASGQAST